MLRHLEAALQVCLASMRSLQLDLQSAYLLLGEEHLSCELLGSHARRRHGHFLSAVCRSEPWLRLYAPLVGCKCLLNAVQGVIRDGAWPVFWNRGCSRELHRNASEWHSGKLRNSLDIITHGSELYRVASCHLTVALAANDNVMVKQACYRCADNCGHRETVIKKMSILP